MHPRLSSSNPLGISINRKTRNLRQIRIRRQINNMRILKRRLRVVPPKQEEPAIGEDGGVVPAVAEGFAVDGSGLELEAYCGW